MRNSSLILYFVCCVVYVNGTNINQRTVDFDVTLMSTEELKTLNYKIDDDRYVHSYEQRYNHCNIEDEVFSSGLSHEKQITNFIDFVIKSPHETSNYDSLACLVCNCSSDITMQSQLNRLADELADRDKIQMIKEFGDMINLVELCGFGSGCSVIGNGIVRIVNVLSCRGLTLDEFWREKALKYGVD